MEVEKLESLGKKELLSLIKQHGLVGNNTEKVDVLRDRLKAHFEANPEKEELFGEPMDFEDGATGEEEFSSVALLDEPVDVSEEIKKIDNKTTLAVINGLSSLIKDMDKINDKRVVGNYGEVKAGKSDNLVLIKAMAISALNEFLIFSDTNMTVFDALSNPDLVSENVDSVSKLFTAVTKIKSLALMQHPNLFAIKQLYFLLLGLRHSELLKYA